jgi:hypothetical protein
VIRLQVVSAVLLEVSHFFWIDFPTLGTVALSGGRLCAAGFWHERDSDVLSKPNRDTPKKSFGDQKVTDRGKKTKT